MSSERNVSFASTLQPSMDVLLASSIGNESTLSLYNNGYNNTTLSPSLQTYILSSRNLTDTMNSTKKPAMYPSRSPTNNTEKPISWIPSMMVTTNVPTWSPTNGKPSRYPTTAKAQNITRIGATNTSVIITEPSNSDGMNSQSKTISTEVAFFVVGVVLALFLLIAIVHAWFARKATYAAIPKQVMAVDTREDSITDTLRRLRTSDWLELTPEQIDDMFPEQSPTRSRSNSLPTTYEVDEKVLMDRETNSPFV